MQDFIVSARPCWVLLDFRSNWDLVGVGPRGLGPGLDNNKFLGLSLSTMSLVTFYLHLLL